jgi:hypothetical protein
VCILLDTKDDLIKELQKITYKISEFVAYQNFFNIVLHQRKMLDTKTLYNCFQLSLFNIHI